MMARCVPVVLWFGPRTFIFPFFCIPFAFEFHVELELELDELDGPAIPALSRSVRPGLIGAEFELDVEFEFETACGRVRGTKGKLLCHPRGLPLLLLLLSFEAFPVFIPLDVFVPVLVSSLRLLDAFTGGGGLAGSSRVERSN
jgi:hypothetical protein